MFDVAELGAQKRGVVADREDHLTGGAARAVQVVVVVAADCGRKAVLRAEVVDGSGLERIERVGIVGGDEDDERRMLSLA